MNWDSYLRKCGTTLAATTPNLQIYRQHVWNPLSHNDMDTPIFKDELYSSIKELVILDQVTLRAPGGQMYVGENDGCKISFDHNNVSYTCKMKPLDKIIVYNILGVDYYLDIEVEASGYIKEDNDGSHPQGFDPANPGTVKTARISEIYKELLALAGTDEATIGQWYTRTSVGKTRYDAIV